MPRDPEVPHEYLYSQLKEWRIFSEKGKLKKKSDPIWEDIKKALKLKISSATLYLYVYKNEYSLKDKLQKYLKIKNRESTKIRKQDDDDYQPHLQMYTANCSPLSFDISLPINQVIDSWADKKPRDGWRDVLRLAIWDSQMIPCPYALKDGYITKEQFKVRGHCRECYSDISCEGELTDAENIKFQIKCFATHSIPHSNKIKLTGARRKEVKRDLLTMTGSQYREKQLSKLSTPYEPPHLNTSGSCRKLREEAINENLGYTLFKNISITNKTFLNHCNVKKLSLEPFNIYYWSDKQLKLWNTLQEKKLPLSFDSTGSLVRRYSFYKNVDKSRPINYYVLVIGFEGKIIPLLQALLSNHHVPIILEVFQKWIESGAKIPKEISTDGSLTLQNVVSIAFNGLTYKHYNLHCFKLLMNEVSEVPKCFYRSDVAHLIRTIKLWACFVNADPRIIDFYIRSVGFLTQIETLDQFIDIVTSVIIVSSSTSKVENSLCHQKYTHLIRIFRTFEQDVNEFRLNNSGQIENESEPSVVDATVTTKNKLILFIDKLFEQALNLCILDEDLVLHPNFYYCSEFVKPFQDLCYTFPSWTNVMKNRFASPNDVANSARSETYFKYYKQDVPNPIVVQKILLRDKVKTDALTNFAFTKIPNNEILNEPINEQRSNVLDLNLEKLTISTDINANKNINHLNVSHVSININDLDVVNSTLHLSSAADSLSIHSPKINVEETLDINDLDFANGICNLSAKDEMSVESSKMTHQVISYDIVYRNLILNGNRLPAQEYFIDCSSRTLSFRNTCPFDSIFEIVISMYIENTYFNEDVKNKVNSEPVIGFLHAVLEYCQESFDVDNYYTSRASILYRRYNDRVKNLYNAIIDCQDNVTTLFVDSMKFVPSITQISQCCCGSKEESFLITSSITAKDFYETGLSNLESILKQQFLDKTIYCRTCKKKSAVLINKLHSYIALDVEHLCERKNINIIRCTAHNAIVKKTTLNDLPKKMTFGNKKFELKGVVCFQGDYIKDKSIVHYKTFVLQSFKNSEEKTKANWMLYDSLAQTIQEIEAPEEYMALILFAAI